MKVHVVYNPAAAGGPQPCAQRRLRVDARELPRGNRAYQHACEQAKRDGEQNRAPIETGLKTDRKARQRQHNQHLRTPYRQRGA